MKEIVDFVTLIILYFVVFYKKWKAKSKDAFFINTIMYIYLSFVLYFTLMPIVTYLPSTFYHIVFDHHYKPMNLVLFIDITMGRGDFIRQILLNIIMTIPFGFLFPLVKNQKPKLLKTMYYTFLLSLGIELLQSIINNGRISDITDIITNVIGGTIGYILYFLFKPFTTKILNYIRSR